MKPILLASVLSAIIGTACEVRGTNQTCEWQPSDNPSPLDLRERGQRLHLMDEALRSEDLAIRFADFRRGHRSGNFAGNEAYQQTRDQCMAMLFEAVASHHRITTAQVRDALLYRRASIDLVIVVVFVVFYIFVANAIIQWMYRSITVDARWLRVLGTTVAACVAGTGGLFLFGMYAGALEMIRIGNSHMSYRVGRNPWSRHQAKLLVGAIILFALVAAYRHARDRANKS